MAQSTVGDRRVGPEGRRREAGVNGRFMANRVAAVSSFDQLMNPTLAARHGLGGSASIPELVEKVIADLRCPREVVEQPHGDRGMTELEYRLAWARTSLKKYGLLDNSSRAVWSLTPKGSETTVVEPQDVVKAVRAMFVAERKARTDAEGPAERDIVEAEETAMARLYVRSWTGRLGFTSAVLKAAH
jgi:restriction endonuclease Mrr